MSDFRQFEILNLLYATYNKKYQYGVIARY